MPTEPEEVKLLVRFLRELRGWGQVEIAAAAGIDPSSLCRYEGGKTVPSPATLERLVAAAGLPLSLVDGVLLPAIHAARAVKASATGNALGDPEAAASFGRALHGAAEAAVAAFLAEVLAAEEAADPPLHPPTPAPAGPSS